MTAGAAPASTGRLRFVTVVTDISLPLIYFTAISHPITPRGTMKKTAIVLPFIGLLTTIALFCAAPPNPVEQPPEIS